MAFFPSGRIDLLRNSDQWVREFGIKPVIWFESGSADALVSALYPYCHIVPNSIAIDPSLGQLTYEDGSVPVGLLESFFDSDLYKVYGPLAASEFDRFPRFSTLRSVDRDAICRRVTMYLLGVFIHKKPDFFLASETPHNAVGLIALAVCDFLGIPTLFFQPTSSVGPNMVPRTSVNQIFQTPRLKEKIEALSQRYPTLKTQRAELLTNLLEGYSKNQPPPRFVQQNPAHREVHSSREGKARVSHRRGLSARLMALRGLISGRAVDSVAIEAILHSYRKDLEMAANRLPSSTLSSAPGPTALFGLHYQPERTSIPEGPLESSQLVSIMRVRRFLPPKITLYVKEHPSQISKARTGYLGRSVHFYEFLKDMPGVEVLAPGFSMEELLSQVSAVFTLTGTLGIQAAVSGIPSIYLGNPWWEGMPGSWKFESLKSIEQVNSSMMPSFSEVRDFLLFRILVESIPGFSTPSQQKSWNTVDPSLYQSVLDYEGVFFKEVLNEFLEQLLPKS